MELLLQVEGSQIQMRGMLGGEVPQRSQVAISCRLACIELASTNSTTSFFKNRLKTGHIRETWSPGVESGNFPGRKFGMFVEF